MGVTIHEGDCREVLPTLPDQSVHCIVTSPPYWGLRDYGVSGQIGLEQSFLSYIGQLVEVFEDARRVLRDDGTCWVNLGDAYAGSWGAQSRKDAGIGMSSGQIKAHPKGQTGTGSMTRTPGLKPKDLLMLPARFAIAMQANGWWLRKDIIWHKPNPMPESITDRPTSSHEHIFLFAKAEQYYYDADAIREDYAPASLSRYESEFNPDAPSARAGAAKHGSMRDGGKIDPNPLGRNARDVWTIPTRSFPEAHFATFPPDLPERCIKAGCPTGGTVLDPFGGAGTTGLVADRLQRNAILIELNPEYAAMARARITDDAGLFSEVAA